MEYNMDTVLQKRSDIPAPFDAEDAQPYIFISYAHTDSALVYPVITKIYEAGYRVWYDEGIEINSDYNDVIAKHIKESALFLMFVSRNACASKYVMGNELHYANRVKDDVQMRLCFLERDVELPEGADMVLGGVDNPKYEFVGVDTILEDLRGVEGLEPVAGKRKAAGKTKPAEEGEVRVAEEGDEYTFELIPGGVRLTKYNGSAEEVVVPARYKGQRVLELSGTFKDNKTVRSVVISRGLRNLGLRTFDGCTSLTQITIPDSVTDIGDWAFYDCTSLTQITIPDSVTSIGDWAFDGCSSLTAITIPDSVTSIGGGAFEYCSSLAAITIPDSVTSIGSGAFYDCCGLTGIIIPNSVTSIGDSAFKGCSSLTAITIPDSVTSIGSGAFYDCCGLTAITIPDSVTSIGSAVFYGCSSLTGITMPGSIESIGRFAFGHCSSLTAITIPDSVTSMGDRAFLGCSSLTSITMPDSVTSVGNGAFSRCRSLTDISVNAGNKTYCGIDGVLFSNDRTKLISYPNAHGSKYAIPDGVTSIGKAAFLGCSSLTCITIPDSVTSIESEAFNGCSSLTAITIPDSVTSIGDWAFWGCSSLTAITIPDSVTSIGDSAFYDCSSLTAITIPDSVTSIGDYAFSSSRPFFGFRKLTIYCSKNSHAWQYCKMNIIKHKPLSVAPAEGAPRKKSPARWLVPLLILLALAAAAGLQLSGLVDILSLLGL